MLIVEDAMETPEIKPLFALLDTEKKFIDAYNMLLLSGGVLRKEDHFRMCLLARAVAVTLKDYAADAAFNIAQMTYPPARMQEMIGSSDMRARYVTSFKQFAHRGLELTHGGIGSR